MQDPLAGQRRESLAQLSGIRSKIGVWETKVDNPIRSRPKGVPAGARPILPIGGAGIGRLGAPKRAGLLPPRLPSGLASVAEDAEDGPSRPTIPAAKAPSPALQPAAASMPAAVPSGSAAQALAASAAKRQAAALAGEAANAVAATAAAAAAAKAAQAAQAEPSAAQAAAMTPAAAQAAVPEQPATPEPPAAQDQETAAVAAVPEAPRASPAAATAASPAAQPAVAAAELPAASPAAFAGAFPPQRKPSASPAAGTAHASPEPQQLQHQELPGPPASPTHDTLPPAEAVQAATPQQALDLLASPFHIESASEASETAAVPQQAPPSPALSDASTVSIGRRPSSLSVLAGSGGSSISGRTEIVLNSGGSAPESPAALTAAASTPAADTASDAALAPASGGRQALTVATDAAAATPVPPEQEGSAGAMPQTAPRSALGSMMERAWSAAGRWATTPILASSTSSSPATPAAKDAKRVESGGAGFPVAAAASPATAATPPAAAAEAEEAVAVAVPTPASAQPTAADALPTEAQAGQAAAAEPTPLSPPRPQSPPATAERWQLGEAASPQQQATPVATPPQLASPYQGSPDVFSTPAAELHRASPGSEDSGSEVGGTDEDGDMQPVPFGLDTPCTGGRVNDRLDGGSSNSSGADSPAASSAASPAADGAAGREVPDVASPDGMLRISPLPDCRGGVPQRKRTPELITAADADAATPATAEISTPTTVGGATPLTPGPGLAAWVVEAAAKAMSTAADDLPAPTPVAESLAPVSASPAPSFESLAAADSLAVEPSPGTAASELADFELAEADCSRSCPGTPAAALLLLEQPECPPTVAIPSDEETEALATASPGADAGFAHDMTGTAAAPPHAAEVASAVEAEDVSTTAADSPAAQLTQPEGSVRAAAAEAAPIAHEYEPAAAAMRCEPLSLVIMLPDNTPEEAAEDLPLTSPALSDGSLFSGSRKGSSSSSGGTPSRQSWLPCGAAMPPPPLPAASPAPSSPGHLSLALARAIAAANAAASPPAPRSPSPAAEVGALANEPATALPATPQQPAAVTPAAAAADPAATPGAVPAGSAMSPSLLYAMVDRDDDQDEATAQVQPSSPAAVMAAVADSAAGMAEPAAAEAPAAVELPADSQPSAPPSPSELAAAEPTASEAAAPGSPDPFRPTAAWGLLPFTPVASWPPRQQQAGTPVEASAPQAPAADIPAVAPEVEGLAGGEQTEEPPADALAAEESAPLTQQPAAAAGVAAAEALITTLPQPTAAPEPATPPPPSSSIGSAISPLAAAPEPQQAAAAAATAPATAGMPAVTIAEDAPTDADCTVSGAWSASPPALAATGALEDRPTPDRASPLCLATVQGRISPQGLMPAEAHASPASIALSAPGISPCSIAAAQRSLTLPVVPTPDTAEASGGGGYPAQPGTADGRPTGSAERFSVTSNLAFGIRTLASAGGASRRSLSQAVMQTPQSGASGPYPMTIRKLRITEPADAHGEMPEAFDGGGLGGAATATPAARRFGLQMSPPNAAARQDEAGNPGLRVGLTPHIRALRTSLAHEEADDDTGSPEAAASAQPQRRLSLSGQRGGRRASLAEAPRPNLLFEPATEAEEAALALREEAAQLRKQNALLTAEVAGARDSVSQLLDRISGMQVDAEGHSRLLNAKLERAAAENAALAKRLEQLREAKAAEKAQFRALHEQKYLPLKKRCAAAESEVARLETAAAQQSQEAAERATERERQLHAARTASAAAEQRAAGAHAAQQELGRELEAQAAAAAAANAELTQLRGRAREADAAEAANSAMAKDNAALRRQLEEVMLSHDAAVQSKDRALAQASAKEEEICRQAAALKKTEYTLGACKAELERGLQAREATKTRIAGLQEQLKRVEKDRQDLLEICHGRLAGVQAA